MSMPVISAMDFTGDKMVDETAPNDSPMKRFYRHKTVFITGGTGFLGQLFIEKLLRCKVKEIYVLARPKKSKSPAERIQEIFVGALFAKLKSTDPKYLTKIKIIDGDTSKVDLGISDGDRKKIIENVEIVIHAAANVRFDIPLQELCFTNVRGTKVLTALAGEIKKLVVFAYVSTAYAQYYREKFEEKFYPPAIDPDQMIRIAEHFEQCQTDELNFLTDKLLQPWKNTYVFTKSLAEEVVRRAGNKFPIVVIRPSVIISTFDDPIPGWSNNFYGLNGMVVGTGLGFIKLCPCKAESKNDAVCADIVTNGTLAAIWCKAIESESTDAYNFDESKAVVHITSQDPVDYGTYTAKLLKLYLQNPSAKSIWFPSVTFTDSRFLIFVLSILYHAIPAAMFDVYFKLTKNELRLLPIYRKSQDFLARLDYFANREWHFVNKNLKTVIEKMCPEDRDFFHCDVFNFKLLEYSYVYVLGLRAYVVKEPLTIDEAAKRKFLLLRFAHYLTTFCCYGVLGCIIYLFLHVAGLAYHLTIFCNSLLSLLDPDEVHAASGSNLTFVTKKIRLMK